MMVVSPASAPAAPALSGARGDVASHKGGFAGALSAQHEGASAAGDAHTRSLQPAPASALPATATAGTESDPEPAQDAEASIAFDGATALASLQARAEPQTAPTQPAGAALPHADEPTAALDPHSAHGLFALFMDVVEELQLAALVVSHDWALIETFGVPRFDAVTVKGETVFEPRL